MDYEDELQAMQDEALAELDGDNENDTDENDNRQDEYSDDSTDESKHEEDEHDSDEYGNEDETDIERNKREDAESFDDEDDVTNNGDEDEDDDNTTNGKDSDTKKGNASFEPVEVEVNGQTITLDTQEELLSFVKNKGEGIPKRQRKSHVDQIAEQGDISREDLQLFIDAKNGDQAAILRIAQNAKVDPRDLDAEEVGEYIPKFEPKFMTEVDEVAQDIMEDKELHASFTNVVATVPDSFKSAIASNPKALKNFAAHIKSGLAQEVIPMVVKEQALKGGDFLDIYARLGREVSGSKKDPKENKQVRKVDPRAEKLRKQAKNPKGSNKGTKTKTTGDDIWEMSTEDFTKKYM